MLDAVTLDQLRTLVSVAEEGSFSAAARRLKRVQSAVSTAMANLEAQLEVPVWDRSTRVPSLTPHGKAVLAQAKRILAEVDDLRRLTADMGHGVETQVSLCIDAIFPPEALIALCTQFTQAFPRVDLRIDTQVLSAVSARVRAGAATLGIAVPAGIDGALERRALAPIRMVPVVAPAHPLASVHGRLRKRRLGEAIQIVLSERTSDDAAGIDDQGVLSERTWRVADLHTKHMLLRAGLGWGNLPEHLAREDLRAGRLVALAPEAWGRDEHTLTLSVIHRSDSTFGPAHRWLLEHLPVLCAEAVDGTRAKRPSRTPRTLGRRR